MSFFDWFDRTVAAVSPEVAGIMARAGFTPYHTGGGCMAWKKDDGTCAYWLITADDCVLDAPTDSPEWMVAHYAATTPEGYDETWALIQGCSLLSALTLADTVRDLPHGDADYHITDICRYEVRESSLDGSDVSDDAVVCSFGEVADDRFPDEFDAVSRLKVGDSTIRYDGVAQCVKITRVA